MSLARKILPLADRVLVKRFFPATKTAGGILLPESATPKHDEGEVLAVGPGITSKDGILIAPQVAVGDRVLLPEYGGMKLKSEKDEELLLYSSQEILAKIA
mmetsp:Transcript_16392/g.16514  ORF Transcript_16392/g.16514 Transcript_16392/m.16514 type:complete len:101 (+) Transcript_16392:137-439(+)|eukprot:CAMPEP_0182416650 /NCGR_PEP_ID=MMETSP1167-20130531/1022_1 /TAXON_ID=2988 /ORGANISM="Mallomonas Sp, Strain CCMP3275" /LENGTH=100 /DNA_ID=CAMNT_0024589623 /DNA_START=110 /DNA_END=412 /DNA_ORIENTATION=+